MHTTVIICTYTEDRWSDLASAIDTVLSQRPSVPELLVVVDHAPVLEARVRDAYPDLTVLANAGRQGLSGGRNTGIAAAAGDIVVFLDDDAAAGDDWLIHLLAPFEDPNVWVTGGLAEARFDAPRPRWFPPQFDWVVGCTYEGHPIEGELRNPIGCNMAFRRAALDDIEWFQEDMGRSGSRPLGCEETELCIRIQQRHPRCRIVLAPDAPVTQRVPAERATARYFVSRCYSEGLSKAQVTRSVGKIDGLQSERAYTTRVLPLAVGHNVAESIRHRSLDGIARSAMIAVGLIATAAGYARGSLPR